MCSNKCYKNINSYYNMCYTINLNSLINKYKIFEFIIKNSGLYQQKLNI